MSSNAPTLQSFVVMPGPNVSAVLPGVRLRVRWPDAAIRNGDAVARRAISRILASHAFHAVDLMEAVEETKCMADGQRTLDRTVAHLANAVMRLSAQPTANACIQHELQGVASGIAVHHRDASLAADAGRAALAIVAIGIEQDATSDATPTVSDRIDRILAEFRSRRRGMEFGEMNWRKIETAERRDIPWRRLIDRDRIIQLGHGRRQVRTRDSMIEADSHIATYLATNKHIASELLRGNGLPAPRNIAVLDRRSALQAARTLGYPVVVKPALTDFGTAVSVNLLTEDAVSVAFDQARRHGPVVVEQHVSGTNHRLLVMHGRFLAAVRQDPAHVIGDGIHRVDQLVHLTNRGRSEHLSASLKKIEIDAESVRVLQRQGLALDSVPMAERRVLLRDHSNLSLGGSYESVTATVHPDNRSLAERAAHVVGLRVAGIDFITPDVSRSHLEVGGKICEINPSPGFVMGEPDYVVEEAYFDGLFPDGGNGRIPIIAVLCDHVIDDLIMRLERIAAELGHLTVAATPGAIRCGGKVIAANDVGQAFAVGAALQDPSATAAIVQLTRRGTLEEGLVFDRCALAIVPEVPDGTGSQDGLVEIDQDMAIAGLLARHSRRVLHLADEPDFEAAVREALLGNA